MLVGFRGSVWGGGDFESRARTPERAAEIVYQKVKKNFPEGPNSIVEACVTDFPHFAVTLKRIGEKFFRVSEQRQKGLDTIMICYEIKAGPKSVPYLRQRWDRDQKKWLVLPALRSQSAKKLPGRSPAKASGRASGRRSARRR